ncbi:uncharacterized protein [Watersipora subatra]|uniref:uncharacterized protein n=1 Tax=Watersipora subatra TaxID=2589382 RepID=UPI00355C5DAD
MIFFGRNQYSALQQEHLEKLREEIIGNREDVSIKNKKLSAETNKRRRELANKKKTRETEEEKRRLEILAERKARIQDVTCRYQRGGAPKNHTHQSPRSRATRNRRAFSAPVMRNNQINLEDALRTIRGSTQQQYNIGDSGSVFLQKYGAHLQAGSIPAVKNIEDATSTHSQSVRDPTNQSSSMFEAQLAQHQATLKKNTVDTTQVFNERLMQEIRSANLVNPNLESSRNDDHQSIESLDSLESEQPSFSSHVISSGAKQSAEQLNSNNSNSLGSLKSSVGDGTYRQESPTVLVNDSQAATATKDHNQLVPKLATKTACTHYSDASTFVGFQVVNNERKHSKKGAATQQQDLLSEALKSISTHTEMADSQTRPLAETAHRLSNGTLSKPILETVTHSRLPDQNDTDSFYLKSRRESQTIVTDFPTHAWAGSNMNQDARSTMDHSGFAVDRKDPHPSPTNRLEENSIINNDDFNESASDCGAPRSILKRRDLLSTTLPRSHSSPNIRDSLEVTKQHQKSSKVQMPQSAKKTVRFSPSQSEPVFFQKGSSPSSIPRPVQKAKPNVPHISGAITPNVAEKSVAGKPPSSSAKGPVVADHNIQVSGPAGAKARIGEASMVNLFDIPLDKTPTDAEIDVLWDKVRDCLLDSPSSSRSAPADVQHHTQASEPPKQSIKKITASNINQIGRAQSTGLRRGTSSDSGQSPLHRPKQDQKSFLQSAESTRSAYTNDTVTRQHGLTNGHSASSGHGGPTQSASEPAVSAMVNNTPQNMSESMMAYLTAEKLAAHESLSDQEIIRAMDSDYRQQLAENGRPVVPMSALSIEEHRILQSLDRLNDKLKVVEDGPHSYRSNQGEQPLAPPMPASSVLYNGHTSANHSGFANTLSSEKVQLKPHPPYKGGPHHRSFSATPRGFRGHKPLHPRQRTTSADIIRQNATVSGAQINGSNRQFRLY